MGAPCWETVGRTEVVELVRGELGAEVREGRLGGVAVGAVRLGEDH